MKRTVLLEARLKKEMTQQEVAEKIGTSKQQYNRIENGVQIGSVPLWDALEDLFGIPQRQLRVQQSAPNENRVFET